jgi:hypothetical protein
MLTPTKLQKGIVEEWNIGILGFSEPDYLSSFHRSIIPGLDSFYSLQPEEAVGFHE